MMELDFELIFHRIREWKPTSQPSVEVKFLDGTWNVRYSCDCEEWIVTAGLVHRVYKDLVKGRNVGKGVVDQFCRLQTCPKNEIFDCMERIVSLNVLEGGEEDFCGESYTDDPCRARL